MELNRYEIVENIDNGVPETPTQNDIVDNNGYTSEKEVKEEYDETRTLENIGICVEEEGFEPLDDKNDDRNPEGLPHGLPGDPEDLPEDLPEDIHDLPPPNEDYPLSDETEEIISSQNSRPTRRSTRRSARVKTKSKNEDLFEDSQSDNSDESGEYEYKLPHSIQFYTYNPISDESKLDKMLGKVKGKSYFFSIG